METKNKTPEPEFPKLNPFDKKYFWSINIGELIADVGLIIYSILFSKYFISDPNIIQQITTTQLLALYIIIVLTLPWFLGYIYVRYSMFYNKNILQIIRWLFIFIILFILFFLMRIMLSIPWDEEGQTSVFTTNLAWFATFMLVLGPMMGIGGVAAGYNEFKPKDKTEDASPTVALLIIVLSVFFLVWGMGKYSDLTDNSFLGFFLTFGIMFGGCFVAVLIFAILLAIKSLLEKIGVYKFLSAIAQNIFPFFIITTLILWNEIGLHYIIEMFGNDSGKLSPHILFISLTLTGFIPFRLMTLFSPPLKAINIFVGLVAFGFYVWNILGLSG